MPGLPIMFRTTDVGFAEPTTIYACVEEDGKWELVKEITIPYATIEHIVSWIRSSTAPNKPIYVPDDMPKVRYELQAAGLRVR